MGLWHPARSERFKALHRHRRIKRCFRCRCKIAQRTAPHQSRRRSLGNCDCECAEIVSCGRSKTLAANFVVPPFSNVEPGGILQIWESSTPEFRRLHSAGWPACQKATQCLTNPKTLDAVDRNAAIKNPDTVWKISQTPSAKFRIHNDASYDCRSDLRVKHCVLCCPFCAEKFGLL
jgi:hypothetical protein